MTNKPGDILVMDYPVEVEDEPLTAAAQTHTGAMIALVPSDADLARLALEDGEPADELHLTLAYLGEAAGISDEMRQQIIDAASQYFTAPVSTEAFSINVFNPHTTERDTALVLGIKGEALEGPRSNVVSAVRGFFDMPEQHAPWIPHVTMIYTDELARGLELTEKLGPITFDKIRFAFGGEVTDLCLGVPLTAAFWREKDHPRDTEGQFAETGNADFVKRLKKASIGKDAVKAVDDGRGKYYRMATGLYQTGHDQLLNHHFRTGEPLERGDTEDWSTTRTRIDLDDMLSDAAIKKDIQVFRGIKDPAAIFGDAWNPAGDNSGLTWLDKGYVSTSANEDVASKIFSAGNTVMRLLVPKGTSAAYLTPTVVFDQDEQEILLNRGLKFRIMKDNGIDDDGIRHIDVEVIGHEPISG